MKVIAFCFYCNGQATLGQGHWDVIFFRVPWIISPDRRGEMESVCGPVRVGAGLACGRAIQDTFYYRTIVSGASSVMVAALAVVCNTAFDFAL